MIISKKVFFILISFSLAFSISCKTKKVAVNQVKLEENPLVAESIEKLKNNNLEYSTLSARLDGDFKSEAQNASFKTNIRIKKDSIIWMSATALMGIEVFRIIITPDSVKFLNRLNKTYLVSDLENLSKIANVYVDFELIESLLTANFYAQKTDNFKNYNINNQLVLTNLRKKTLKRFQQKHDQIEKLEKKDKIDKLDRINLDDIPEKIDSTDFIEQSIWVYPDIFKIFQYRFQETKSNRILEMKYDSYTNLPDSSYFPKKISTILGNEKLGILKGEFVKIEKNIDLTYPFSIPESYAPIKLNK